MLGNKRKFPNRNRKKLLSIIITQRTEKNRSEEERIKENKTLLDLLKI